MYVCVVYNYILYYGGTEWPSGLRRRLRRAPTPVRSQLRMAFVFGQSRCQERKAAIPHPSIADTYGCLKNLQPYK